MKFKLLYVLPVAAVGLLSAPAPGGGDIDITLTPMGGSIGEFFSNDVLAGYEYIPPEGLGPEGDITVILTPMDGSIGKFFSNDVLAGYEYNPPGGLGPEGDITVILTPMGGSIGEFFSNDVIAGYEYNPPEGAGPLGADSRLGIPGGPGAVPTPGTIFVIGLGSLLARRRRRAT